MLFVFVFLFRVFVSDEEKRVECEKYKSPAPPLVEDEEQQEGDEEMRKKKGERDGEKKQE